MSKGKVLVVGSNATRIEIQGGGTGATGQYLNETVVPAKAEELQALLLGMVEPSRAEPGNLRRDIWQDQAEPGRFVLDELYTGDAAVAAHRETPHFKHCRAKITDLADRTALVLDALGLPNGGTQHYHRGTAGPACPSMRLTKGSNNVT